MDDFPSNSHASRSRTPDASPTPAIDPPVDSKKIVLDPVVTGKVIRRKKSALTRITETLFRGESSVLGYLFQEVLVPALKDMATSMVTQGIEKAMYGEVRSPRGGTTRGGYSTGNVYRPHVSYDRPSAARGSGLSPSARRLDPHPSADRIEDIVVETKFEAQSIIDALFNTVHEYGQATVGHLNNLIGQTSVYTDHNWGWTNLESMTARRVSGGYLLELPPPEPLR